MHVASEPDVEHSAIDSDGISFHGAKIKKGGKSLLISNHFHRKAFAAFLILRRKYIDFTSCRALIL